MQRDAFGNIVELDNQANAPTIGSQSTAEGKLNIVEVQVYKPVG